MSEKKMETMAALMDMAEDRYVEEAASAMTEVMGEGAKAADGGAEVPARSQDQKDGRKKDWKRSWKRWTALAACLCLVVAGAAAWSGGILQSGAQDGTGAQSPTDSDLPNTTDEIPQGLWIPAVELPEGGSDISMDMVALVVYDGGVYVDTGDHYIGQEAEQIRGLVGEKLGDAKGSIDEWSSQDAYAEEFASSIPGSVYMVKGYDKSFRLCMVNEYEEDGETVPSIMFLERLNGIAVDTGADVFGDRLHLAENWTGVEQVDHETWFYWDSTAGDLPKSVLKIADEDWQAFLDELYAGKFEDLQGTDVYDRAAVHLYVRMADHTVVHLRMTDDGYVLYDGLLWYGVKVSDGARDAVLAAMEK